MERSEDEDPPHSQEAGLGPSASARALARSRSALEARRERIAIRLRHPAFRDADAEGLLREASEIAIAAELAREDTLRDVLAARPSVAARPLPDAQPPPAARLPLAVPLEPIVPFRPVAPSPPVSEAEPAAVAPSSRWDERAPPGAGRRLMGRVASGLARGDVLRVALLALLVGGGVYGGLLAVQPGEDAPPVTVRPPEEVRLRPIRVRTVRIPVQPPPTAATAAGAAGPLDLRGTISGFVQVVPGTPAEACAKLLEAGWTTQGWGDSPVGAEGECLADRRYGADGATNSFAVLRGGHTLNELRIKLNLGDAETRGQAGRDAGRLVAALFETWRWEGGPALGNRIAALQPFDAVVNGTTVRLTREFGDVERMNLLMRFPRPPKAPGAELAAAQAASLAALSAVVATHLGGSQAPAEPETPQPPKP